MIKMDERPVPFEGAGRDNPAFVKIGLYDEPAVARTEDSLPYATTTAAVIGYVRDTKFGRNYLRMMVLDEPCAMQEPVNYRVPKQGDCITRPMDAMDVEELQPTAALNRAYGEAMSVSTAPRFTVRGRLYTEDPTYDGRVDPDRELPMFKAVPGTERTWELDGHTLKDGSMVDDVESAQKWLLENHPDYLMGSFISDKGGSICMMAAPSSEYPKGMYENAANRMKFAKSTASHLGVHAGESEYGAIVKEAEEASPRDLPDIGFSAGGSQKESDGLSM